MMSATKKPAIAVLGCEALGFGQNMCHQLSVLNGVAAMQLQGFVE